MPTVSSGVTSTVAAGQSFGLNTQGNLTNFSVDSGGTLNVYGSVGQTYIEGVENVYAGGTGEADQVGTGGQLNIFSGGVETVGPGGNPFFGGSGTITVYAGGVISNLDFGGEGAILVLSGGTAATAGYYEGGLVGQSEFIFSGGLDSGSDINGTQNVYYGGTALSDFIEGTQNVYAGGTSDDAGIAGTQNVYSGADIISGMVEGADYPYPAGVQNVYSGAVVSGEVLDGGVQDVYSGGTISGTIVEGGTLNLFSGAQGSFTISYGNVNVESGYVLSGLVLPSGTALYLGEQIVVDVSSGGTTKGITISAGDTAYLQSGAVDAGPIVFATGAELNEIYGEQYAFPVYPELAVGDTASAALSGLMISGLQTSDTIDLTNIAFVSGATASVTAGNLVLSIGGSTFDIGLVGTNPAIDDFIEVSSDGNSGTDVTIGGVSGVMVMQNPASGTYVKAGAVVSITLYMGEDAKVTGTPKLVLNDGGAASYVTGTGSSDLLFKYTVAAGQSSSDLEIVSASLTGATVSYTSGGGAALTGVDGFNLGIVVDAATPKVTGITTTPGSGGTAGLGDTVAIDLHFSDAPLVVGGTPALKLSDGGVALYVGGSSNPGEGVLEFDYLVSSSQNASDLSVTGISVTGGASITDSAGNPADLSLTSALHIDIDSIRPTVVSAGASPSSGTVSNGETVSITLKLSEAVVVSGGGPVLEFNDGATAGFVGASTASTLVFTYFVGSETTADLTIIGIENGATVTGSAGNSLSDTLSENLKLAVNADEWKTGRSGLFGAGSNWTLSAPPTPTQEAVISVGGTYTVSVTANETVGALAIDDKTATLQIGSGATFSATDGTGVDFDAGTVVVHNDATLAAGGTFNNSGTITLSAGATLDLFGAVTLGGSGKIALADSTIGAAGSGATLINTHNLISGLGTIGGNANLSLINAGAIEAAKGAAGLQIETGSNTIVNSGTIEATADADLGFNGSPIDNSGIIGAVGTSAFVLMEETLLNGSGGSLVASGADATLVLFGVDINGGILKTGGAGAAIDGFTNNTVTDATIAPHALLEETGDSLVLDSVAVSSGASVEISGANGTLTLSGGTIAAGATVEALSQASATITGAVTNSGMLEAGKASDLVVSGTVVNGGYVQAAVSGSVFIEDTVANSKTIEALGSGAVVTLSGAVSNTASGLLLVSGSGAQIVLDEADIAGGRLQTVGGGTIDTASSSTNVLSGVALAAGSVLDVTNSGTVTLEGTIGNSGTISVSTSGIAVTFSGAVTLSGGGRIVLADTTIDGVPAGSNGPAVVTNVNDVISGAGLIGTGDGLRLNLINGGVIDSNNESGLTIATGNAAIVNSGTLEATALGFLTIESDIDNSKTVEASGSNALVEIEDATISNTGAGLLLVSGRGNLMGFTAVTVSGGTLRDTGSGNYFSFGGDDALLGATVSAESVIEVGNAAALTLSGGSFGTGAIVETLTDGTAIVSGTVSNGGTLFASGTGSELEIAGGGFVKGGLIEIANGEVVLQGGGSTSAEIVFTSTGSGGLVLDGTGSATYSALRISGFGGVSGSATEQFIDFTQVTSGAGVSAVYVSAASHTSGTLEVVSGATLLAEVTLIGSKYTTSDFHVSLGISGSVEITDPAPSIAGGTVTTLASTGNGAPATTGAASVALLGNYMAALFASPEGQVGAQPAAPETAPSQAVLVHPHTG